MAKYRPGFKEVVLIALALGAVSCQAKSDADSQQAVGLTQDQATEDTARVERLEALYLTARGLGLVGDGWSHSDTLQAPVDQTLASRLLLPVDDRVCIDVWVEPDPEASQKADLEVAGLQRVCMEYDPDHEGKLFRLHVDAPEQAARDVPGEPCLKAVVLGFYSKLWSTGAVDDQRYKCILCGEVLVCGADPSCGGS